jgi:pimeloyl-ACP methyl ester carboxylesterase
MNPRREDGPVQTFDMAPDVRVETLDGVRTRTFVSDGDTDRPTVVLLHGGDVRSLSNATDFSTLWGRAGNAPRFVAPDKPGQGGSFTSDDLSLGLDPDGLVAHLEAVVDRYCTGPVVLLGHSRGALPVMGLALARPERIAGLVLVSSNTLAPPSPVTPADFYPTMYRRTPDEPLSDDYVAREASGNSFRSDHVADLVTNRWEVARQPGWWESHAERTRLHDEDLRPRLAAARDALIARLGSIRLDMPVLTFWGSEDVSAPELLGPALQEVLRPAFASSDHLVLSGARHYVYRDRAVAFQHHLNAWLAGVPGW